MRDFSGVKRLVIKIGTNVLSKNYAVDTEYLRVMAGQIAHLAREGRQVLVVTSGAVGMGAGELGIREKITSVKMRQACASIGQPLLMKEYKDIFREYGMRSAQILLTREVLNNRKTYLNLRLFLTRTIVFPRRKLAMLLATTTGCLLLWQARLTLTFLFF